MANKKFLEIKNMRQLQNKIEQDISDVAYREQTATKVAKEIVKDIRDIKGLKPTQRTKDMRKVLEKLNKTHPEYSINKINFTFTGELLDDLWRNVKRFRFGKRRIVFNVGHSTKKHRAYKKKGAKRKTSGKGVKQLPYLKIYNYLGDIDIRYRYLRRKFSKRTKKNIVKILKRSIVDFYLKRNR